MVRKTAFCVRRRPILGAKNFGFMVKYFLGAKLTHAASIEKILECAYLRPKKPVFAPGAKKGAFIDSAPIVRLRARKRPKRADLRTSARTGAKVPHARIWPRTKRLPRTGPKVAPGPP